MKRFLVLFAALGALLLFHGEALASHFRYGTIGWVVPDPQTQPTTVKLTVTYAIAAGSALSLQDITFYFGDNTSTGEVVGPVVGNGTDAGGQAYEVRELTATHTYAAPGTYTAYFDDCCRISQLINGGGGSGGYRVDTTVVLQPGNTSGPVSASPAVIQLQLGGTRTYTWPAFDPDGDPVTCRFGTALESGFEDPVPVVPAHPGGGPGGQSPSLTTAPEGCQLSWDLVDAQAGQRYVVHIVFESAHGGQLSTAALDLIVEIIAPPPPGCTGSGVFIADPGQPFSTMVTGTHALTTPLTVSAIDAPPGSTLSPGASGLSPFPNTFSWTPQMADTGTTIVVVNYRNELHHTGTCFLTIHVPACAGYGETCFVGDGQCASSGTNVCAGPGQTMCTATAGSPTDEVCDGLDNDCDGAVDDGFEVGSACASGVGACEQAGAITCDGNGGAACSAVPGTPAEEVCGDDVDQDCDGALDNGCPGGVGGGGAGDTGGAGGAGGSGAAGGGGGVGGGGGAGGAGGSGSGAGGGGGAGGEGGSGAAGGTGSGAGGGGGTGSGAAGSNGAGAGAGGSASGPDGSEPPEPVAAQGSGVLCATRPSGGSGSPVLLVTLALGGLLAARRRHRR